MTASRQLATWLYQLRGCAGAGGLFEEARPGPRPAVVDSQSAALARLEALGFPVEPGPRSAASTSRA